MCPVTSECIVLTVQEDETLMLIQILNYLF